MRRKHRATTQGRNSADRSVVTAAGVPRHDLPQPLSGVRELLESSACLNLRGLQPVRNRARSQSSDALREDHPDLAAAVDLQIELLQLQRRVQSRVSLPSIPLDATT